MMTVLHAADGSPHSEGAEQLLMRIPFPAETEIIVANVVEEYYVSPFGDLLDKYDREAMHRDQVAHAKELLTSSVSRLSERFINVRQELLSGHAAEEITKLADSEQVDLVSIGARGMNALERFLLGSTSEKVLSHAPCSVLVAHRPGTTRHSGSATEPLRLLVTFDGSPAVFEAVETLIRHRLTDSVEIVLLYVHSLVTSFRADILHRAGHEWQHAASVARAALDQAARRLEAAGAKAVGVTVHEAPQVSTEILNVAETWRADIILAGDTGKSGVDRFLLGSVSKRLTRHAPCSVWIARKRRTAKPVT